MNRQNTASWLALFTVVLLGLWLRWPGLSHGYTSDEVSLVLPWSFWEMMWTGESAVNPPWFAAILNSLFDTHAVTLWGRRWSMLMSAITLFCIALFGGSYGRGSLWAGVTAAALFAFHPWAIDHASVFRVYATTTAVAAWHVLALGRLLNDHGTRGWVWQLGLSAFLLPQLHYYWFPVLGLLAVALLILRRRWAWAYAPAGLGMLPWLIFMALYPAHQNPSGITGSWASIQMLATTGSHFGLYWVVPVGIWGLVLFRWLNPPTRFALFGALCVIGVTALVGQFQMVRPPVSLFLLIWLCAIIAGAVGRIPTHGPVQWGQPIAAISLIGAMTSLHQATNHLDTPAQTPHSSVLRFHQTLPRLLSETSAQAVVIDPSYYLPVLHLYQTSRPISKATDPCADNHHCYRKDGVLYSGVISDAEQAPTSLVFSAQWAPPTAPDHCSEWRSQPTYTLWICRGTPSPKEDERDRGGDADQQKDPDEGRSPTDR